MPRIVMAPDSFKGTLRSPEAAVALADGWRSVRPDDDIVAAPMADGGEGTLDVLASAIPDAVRVAASVPGPAGHPVTASWLRLPGTPRAPGGVAVVELAQTSGIELLGGRLRPWTASTRGFGVAIAQALAAGVSELVLAIGSSASTDGGVGVLSALGARFTDAAGRPIAEGAAGLEALASVDLDGLVDPPPGGVRVLADVTHPLLGAGGAAAAFGPQKGLGVLDIRRADAALARLAALVPHVSPWTAGAGAAGGTGWGLLVWGAELVAGAPEVAARTGLVEAAADADLVVTGEGSYDAQSTAGKVPAYVARLVPGRAVLVAGRICGDADTSAFAASVSLTDVAGSGAAALADPRASIRAASARVARWFSRAPRGRL